MDFYSVFYFNCNDYAYGDCCICFFLLSILSTLVKYRYFYLYYLLQSIILQLYGSYQVTYLLKIFKILIIYL